VLRREDQAAFAAALRRVSPTPAYPVFFLILARTGLRPGEAAALRVDDVDLVGRRLRVERTWTDGRLGPTKSGRVRWVDMSAELARVLAGYLPTCRQGWLFPGRTGTKPLWSANFQKVMKRALVAAGLPEKLHPHSFRHAWATVLLEEHLADLFYVQRQLGHSSIRTTCDLYARAAEPRNLAAVDALDPVPPPDGRRPVLRLVPPQKKHPASA
jgi:integrase